MIQRAASPHRPRWTWRLIAFLVSSIVFVMIPDSGDAQDQQKSSTFRLTAEAGRWNGAGLRDLPRGASIRVEATADGKVTVLLMDQAGFAAFPSAGVPLLANPDSRNFDFSMTVPEAGDYFLVIDNRKGTEPRTVVVRVTAIAPSALSPEDYRKSANQMLSLINDALKRLFMLDGLEMRLEDCGEARCFADGDDIVPCTEYAMMLLRNMPDPAAGSPVMMFTIFQRLSERLAGEHVLSNGDMDDLAAATMVLLGYRTHAETVAKFFSEPGNAERFEALLTGSERYLVTAERARRISESVADPEILARWRDTFVANFQTSVLEKLRASPPDWLSAETIDAALADRLVE
jgi:hypothetical protein